MLTFSRRKVLLKFLTISRFEYWWCLGWFFKYLFFLNWFFDGEWYLDVGLSGWRWVLEARLLQEFRFAFRVFLRRFFGFHQVLVLVWIESTLSYLVSPLLRTWIIIFIDFFFSKCLDRKWVDRWFAEGVWAQLRMLYLLHDTMLLLNYLRLIFGIDHLAKVWYLHADVCLSFILICFSKFLGSDLQITFQVCEA